MYIPSAYFRKVPVFYNKSQNKVSAIINDVIDWNDICLDLEGLLIYLRFGFCAFNKTPISGVSILDCSESLKVSKSGFISISISN